MIGPVCDRHQLGRRNLIPLCEVVEDRLCLDIGELMMSRTTEGLGIVRMPFDTNMLIRVELGDLSCDLIKQANAASLQLSSIADKKLIGW